MVHLGLRRFNILFINRLSERAECFVSLLLEIKGLSVICKLVMSVSYGLVAGHNLEVLLTKESNVAV